VADKRDRSLAAERKKDGFLDLLDSIMEPFKKKKEGDRVKLPHPALAPRALPTTTAKKEKPSFWNDPFGWFKGKATDAMDWIIDNTPAMARELWAIMATLFHDPKIDEYPCS